MPSKFLKELGIEKNGDSGSVSVISKLGEIEINFPTPNCIEIITPHLLSAETLGRLLYLFYNKLNYLFDYLNYRIVIQEPNPTITKSTIQEYFSLLFSTAFLWKDKQDLVFFCEQKDWLEKFVFRENIVYLYFPDQLTLTNWKPQLIVLKELLGKIGLPNIRFALKQRDKLDNADEVSPVEKAGSGSSQNSVNNNSKKVGEKKNNHKVVDNKSKLNKLSLLREWKERKIFELGVHTRFSTLDGISSPTDYVGNAQQKNYAALAVTDHYNAQSFPEFDKQKKNDLKIIYGCELEMLEDNLPPYIFNHPSQILTEKISDLTYCVFDLETTGFFSAYNEIIEIGYVVWQKGEIIREGEHLICPQREISPEVLTTWYTSIDPYELKKAPKISEVLPLLQKDWQNCILVAHNARNFDYGFLNKVWKEHFNEELPYPILDTLPLSWILFPERKSYSLQRLSHVPGRGKITQTHRALDDSKLLADLLEKLLKALKEKKINHWGEVKELIKDGYFPNRGYKIKVLAANQEGLYNLYRLVTLSHTKRLFKKPCVFRSDLTEFRAGLLIGAAGGQEGELFSLFSSFNSERKKQAKIRFYDYIELDSPVCFRHLWLNGQIREVELKEMLKKIIRQAEELNVPIIASHNVHYCQKKEKILKEIIVANEGMNGVRHSLYDKATLDGKEDRFSYLPAQHLLNLEEIIENWIFLNDKELMNKLIFQFPQKIVAKVGGVRVQQPPLNYSATESVKKEENDLIDAYTQQANELFGQQWPKFVRERIEKEWQIIKGRYVFIYWLAYKVVQKTQQDGSLVGSRGSIGSSFIAYLCGITDLNPLPFYKFCANCKYTTLYEAPDRTYSCYDYREKESCPNCSSQLTMEGHNLPFETFFGWEGEKTPDIDLNFSGEYQKTVHNYVRQLLGEDSVYRIGTINTLSQQTAEIFWKEHLKLRQKLNSQSHIQELINSESVTHWQKEYWESLLKNQQDFKAEKWYKEWVDWEKLKELERKLVRVRKEKTQLEVELKKIVAKGK